MIKIGSKVKFGKYYQENSSTKTPIEWKVLDVIGDKVLLFSEKVLDAKAYNEDRIDITWETCSLRKWLNNEFYNLAFDSDEKKSIYTSNIQTNDNAFPLRMKVPAWLAQYSHRPIVTGGGTTTDKVFLLSWEEGKKYFRKSPDNQSKVSVLTPMFKIYQEYDINNVAIAFTDVTAEPTSYARQHNAYIQDEKCGAWYWFRSPGNTSQMAVSNMNDILYRVGTKVDDNTMGVRPAIWVSKDLFLTDKEKEEIALKKKQQDWKNNGLCQYCGGKFKGLFTKTCSNCGKKKDY